MLNETTAQVLDLLLAKTRVSGEDIAFKLGLSRTAVWKNIEVLRRMGYQIASLPGQGYSITAAPDIPLPQEVRRYLEPSHLPWQVEYMPQCTSTNTLLKQRAIQGAPEGLVLVTDHQTAGRGRRGREWQDAPGNSLLFSALLRPSLPPAALLPLTLIMGVAVGDALMSLGVLCQLKWPNDILVGEAKICGILTEISGEIDHTDFAVVGVGINIRSRPELAEYGATSVDEHVVPPVRAQLLAAVLGEIARRYGEFLAGGRRDILKRWESMSATLHRTVVVHTPSGDITGTAIGVNCEGALLVSTADGQDVVVNTGEVSLRHRKHE